MKGKDNVTRKKRRSLSDLTDEYFWEVCLGVAILGAVGAMLLLT